MGCGCGKNNARSIRGVGPRPIVTSRNRSVASGNPRSRNQISALSTPSPSAKDNHIRRKVIEKKRRELIALRNIKK